MSVYQGTLIVSEIIKVAIMIRCFPLTVQAIQSAMHLVYCDIPAVSS